MKLKKQFLSILYYFGFSNVNSNGFFMKPELSGKWLIKGSKAYINIKEQEIVVDKGVSQISMIPRLISNEPVKIHLNSLKIKKYPRVLNFNAVKAYSWIKKIQEHGIDIEINSDSIDNSTLNVIWSVKEHSGQCVLQKDVLQKE